VLVTERASLQLDALRHEGVAVGERSHRLDEGSGGVVEQRGVLRSPAMIRDGLETPEGVRPAAPPRFAATGARSCSLVAEAGALTARREPWQFSP
jgi:hypothetical protein